RPDFLVFFLGQLAALIQYPKTDTVFTEAALLGAPGPLADEDNQQARGKHHDHEDDHGDEVSQGDPLIRVGPGRDAPGGPHGCLGFSGATGTPGGLGGFGVPDSCSIIAPNPGVFQNLPGRSGPFPSEPATKQANQSHLRWATEFASMTRIFTPLAILNVL